MTCLGGTVAINSKGTVSELCCELLCCVVELAACFTHGTIAVHRTCYVTLLPSGSISLRPPIIFGRQHLYATRCNDWFASPSYHLSRTMKYF